MCFGASDPASYSKSLKVARLYATMKQRKEMMELLTPRA